MALITEPAGTWTVKKSRSAPGIVAMNEFVPTTRFICVGAVGSSETSPLTDSSHTTGLAANDCEAIAKRAEQQTARSRRERIIDVDSTGLCGERLMNEMRTFNSGSRHPITSDAAGSGHRINSLVLAHETRGHSPYPTIIAEITTITTITVQNYLATASFFSAGSFSIALNSLLNFSTFGRITNWQYCCDGFRLK